MTTTASFARSLLAAMCIFCLCGESVQAARPRLALVDFDVFGVGAESSRGRDVAALVRNDEQLRRTYDVIDGDRLRQDAADAGIQIRGSYDEGNGFRLAEQAKADVLITGTLLRYGKTVRLDCTLFDVAAHAMFKCPSVFWDDQPAADREAVRDIARTILGGAEDRQAATVIVDEDFSAPDLDPARWRTGQEEYESDEACEQRGSMHVQNRRLCLEAEAVSASGWSSTQIVRVDSTADLRDQEDYIVEITFSAKIAQGQFTVKFAANPTDQDSQDWRFVTVHQCVGNKHQPLQLDAARVRIEISGAPQTATAYSNQPAALEATGADLSRLKHWCLRMTAHTAGSTGAPRGSMTVKVHDVRVIRLTRGPAVYGRVFNRNTRHPIAEAAVWMDGREGKVKTDGAGQFELACPAGQWKVNAESPGYLPGSPVDASVTATVGAAVELLLEPSRVCYGDVDKVFPLSRLPAEVADAGEVAASTLAAFGDRLYFTLNPPTNTQRHGLCSIAVDGTDIRRDGVIPISGGICFARNELYLSTAFPGGIYKQLSDLTFDRWLDMYQVYGIGEMAYDNQYLWCVVDDAFRNLHLLIAVDLDSKLQVRHIDTTGYNVRGIACDGRRMWISSGKGAGVVYELDRQSAWDDMFLDDRFMIRSFPGEYSALKFANGHLWGLDQERQEICRICLDTAQDQEQGTRVQKQAEVSGTE
jgi:hypothetical protein